MTAPTFPFSRTASLVFAFCCHACIGGPVPPTARSGQPPATSAQAPTLDELKNTSYSGLDERLESVALVNGRWTGAPSPPDAASRPTVDLADDFRLAGDLDGDGIEEAVVHLTYATGGTAAMSFLAVVTRTSGLLRNVATIALGDRVQLQSARIEGGRLLVRAVIAGANDAACCPADLVDWQWTLRDGRMNAGAAARAGRLSVATLAGTAWTLRAWDIGEPAGPESGVSLAVDAGRITGSSGCNRYFAVVEGGAIPAAMRIGPVGGTRMACPEPQSRVETRFLEQLGGARTFGFMVGRLAISYARADGSRGTMLFDPVAE